jgi:PAS domain S-box-containing protein
MLDEISDRDGGGTGGRGRRKISFGRAAVLGGVLLTVLVVGAMAVILGGFLRIVEIAEHAQTEVVPLVLQQQEHAVMATDLARVAEVILGARNRQARGAALDEAETIAHRFAMVADAGVLSKLDSALHAVRRSAYRADVLDALRDSVKSHLARVDTLLPPFDQTAPQTADTHATQILFEARHTLYSAAAASSVEALEHLRDRFDTLRRALDRRAGEGPLTLADGRPLAVETVNGLNVIFDLRREQLFVQTQVEQETITARRLLADLSGGLSADAAAAASDSAAAIVATGRSGISVVAVTLGVGLAVMIGAVGFLLRHVVSPVLRAHAALESIEHGDRIVQLPPASLREFDAVSRSVERLGQVLSEIKVKEAAAQRARQQLQFVFDVSPLPFLMTDVDSSEILEANKAVCALLQVDREVLIGRLGKEFWVNGRRHQEMISFLTREGTVDNFEAHLLTAQGGDFWALLSARIVDLDNGAVVLLGLNDITERKAYEARLQSLVGELENSNQELEQFAYVASHDLQEPLRMVTSYLQLLERKNGDALSTEGREFIGYAVDGARRMQQLIVDLLDYSRVGRNAVQPVPVDMGRIVDKVSDTFRLPVEGVGGKIEVVGPLPVVQADATHMERLLQNLIGNAVKYRSPERRLHVIILARRAGPLWEFAVADNGIGIKPEHAERAFLIFQRLHGNDAYAGTGIGLAICRKIVDMHGGHIWIDSRGGSDGEGTGTTFRFTLPAAD